MIAWLKNYTGLAALHCTTSDQETERVYSCNPGARKRRFQYTKKKHNSRLLREYWPETHRDERLLEQDRFQRRVQRFSEVFQKNGTSEADGVLERAQEVMVGQFDHLETVQMLAGPYPTICLQKRSVSSALQ